MTNEQDYPEAEWPSSAETATPYFQGPAPAKRSFLALLPLIAGIVMCVLVVLSVAMIANVFYNYALAGILVLIGLVALAGAIGFGITLIPLGPPEVRRRFRLLAIGIVPFIALWVVFAGPYGDIQAQRETYAAVTGAKDVAEVRSRLEALAPDNAYADFLLYVSRRTAETKTAMRNVFDQVKASEIDWNLTFDPADKDALLAMRSRLLDIDVLLSGVPDQVKALYRREAEDMRAKAEEADLAADFRRSMDESMAQRHKEYVAFYVGFAAATREAARLLGEIAGALIDGKAKRGEDGKFVYGDDKTKQAVEPLLADLTKVRQAVGKLAEIAKKLDEKYEGAWH
ncbi:hypothetical protein L2U69_12840 [Zavarzinia compransoris]|uniref:hypothetical protein n=1 Tax=Zavarzinia marina TaxID=2911065 RepID=UPI001F195624|nr:hypothetical protein [Zavarzinia marina]MCF4166533.1 hypothetical protein [Zavarzinia marina]